MIITLDEVNYEVDDELSFRVFNGWEFLSRPEYDFKGKTIYASSFYNETPDYQVFPEDMKGAIFIKCNLDNVLIPEGNTLIQCSQRRFKVQNDLNDWLVDEADVAILPVGHEVFTKLDLPMPDPKDIPTEKVVDPIDLRKVAEEKKKEDEVVEDTP